MPKKVDPSTQKTRPDLDDEHYLVWLARQPENRGIDVLGLYRKMLEWCYKKRITPTRLRLLKWLETERQAVPMTLTPGTAAAPAAPPASEAEPDLPEPCDICGKQYCLNTHREERGL